mmetsp:Transcript_5383/g.17981  ORF Transcript_5383/g.17981 Transcript_5383/m.17981 type:complete len:220 (+) Transcript_5383:1631-2290(+)
MPTTRLISSRAALISPSSPVTSALMLMIMAWQWWNTGGSPGLSCTVCSAKNFSMASSSPLMKSRMPSSAFLYAASMAAMSAASSTGSRTTSGPLAMDLSGERAVPAAVPTADAPLDTMPPALWAALLAMSVTPDLAAMSPAREASPLAVELASCPALLAMFLRPIMAAQGGVPTRKPAVPAACTRRRSLGLRWGGRAGALPCGAGGFRTRRGGRASGGL